MQKRTNKLRSAPAPGGAGRASAPGALQFEVVVGADGEVEVDLGPVNLEFVKALLEEVIEPAMVEELRQARANAKE